MGRFTRGRSILTVLVAVVAASLILVGCSSGGGGGGGSSSDVRPALVLDVGGLGDQGFNDSAYAGMMRAKKKYDLKTEYLESSGPTDYEKNITQLADAGYSPIFAIGFLMTDAVNKIAPQYPDQDFAIVDSVVKPKNAASLIFREQEGSYLAGVVAGLMTQQKTSYTNPNDKVVGFLGGQQSDLIGKFQAGYEAGVKSVCSDCKVLVQYVGSTPDAFNNPAAGKEIALSQIDQGADIIYHAAGNTGSGLFDAATEKHIFAIGVDLDQAKLFPKAPILTSVVKRVDNAVYQSIVDAKNGNFPGGQIVDSGLKEKGISLAPYHRFDKDVPQKVKDAVAKAKKGIISGKIKVPSKPE